MRKIVLISSLIFFIICILTYDHISSNSDHNGEEHVETGGHTHDGSSEKEVFFYIGTSSDEKYTYQVMYTTSKDNIIDFNVKILDNNIEVNNKDIKSQLDRISQYVIGYNQFPPLNSDGSSEELTSVTLDMTKIEEAYESAELRES